MLMVCPVNHKQITAASNANGMFRTTTNALRQSRKKINTISPVRIAPSKPSDAKLLMELVTVGD